ASRPRRRAGVNRARPLRAPTSSSRPAVAPGFRATSWAQHRSSGALEPLERLDDLLFARLRLIALLALALDHLLGRAGKEIRVAELGIHPPDVGLDLAHFPFQPRALGREIDHALERQRRGLAAHQELHRALRRRIREGDVAEAGEALQEFSPPPGPLLGVRRD